MTDRTGRKNMERVPHILDAYRYAFPRSLIATYPASPRESAKLLVYDRKTQRTFFDVFRNIGRYVPRGSVLAFNDTKVLPARVTLKKETGGRVKVLYLGGSRMSLRVLSDRRLIKGQKLFLDERRSFRVVSCRDAEYVVKPSFFIRDVGAFLLKYGSTPIPPYIRHTPLHESALRKAYQAVFARLYGSVAAPTASMHFTRRLISSLEKQGVKTAFVTLHVGLGTFAPLTREHLRTGSLHKETYEINRASASLLNRAKREKRPIIAVGTTVVRTLESASDTKGILVKLRGATDLFIRPGYRFKFVDGMVTNFHVPGSSLLMLVSAFAGRKNILALYRRAIRRRMRLFSFGDGMLVL